MKLTIDGVMLDTEKAQQWPLSYMDERSNHHTGDVFRSSKGTWYVFTPSQWSNRHSWVLMNPADILSEYDKYIEEEDKAEIANLAGLAWE